MAASKKSQALKLAKEYNLSEGTIEAIRSDVLSLEDIKEAIKPQLVQVWEGGFGTKIYRTVARTQAEALNNFFEKDPLLQAIGCEAWPMPPIDGVDVKIEVPVGYIFGDDRRAGE